MSKLVGIGDANSSGLGPRDLGLVKYLKSGDGWMGRVVRQGISIRSGVIGGEGRVGAGFDAKNERYGASLVKSGGFWTDVEDGSRDRADMAPAGRTNGEACA